MPRFLARTALLTLSLSLAACASDDEAPAVVVDPAPDAVVADSLDDGGDLLADPVDTAIPPPVLDAPAPNERTAAPAPAAEPPPAGELTRDPETVDGTHTMDDGTVMEGGHDHDGHAR